MAANATGAIQAYTQALRAAAGAPASEAPAAGGGDFGSMLANVLQETAAGAKTAELQMSAAASGQLSLVDVVTAVAEAEVQLETVVAVRDRVVQAYQDIMRMPI